MSLLININLAMPAHAAANGVNAKSVKTFHLGPARTDTHASVVASIRDEHEHNHNGKVLRRRRKIAINVPMLTT